MYYMRKASRSAIGRNLRLFCALNRGYTACSVSLPAGKTTFSALPLRRSADSSVRTMATMASSHKYLSQGEAQKLDAELMSSPGFSVDQLMELAGLSVASATYKVVPPTEYPRVLVVAGPGNNGGDALVAARHLKHFGYRPEVYYPKPAKKEETQRLFENLIAQLNQLDIHVHREANEFPSAQFIDEHRDLILDGIFGFGFTGEVRPPFDVICDRLNQSEEPIVSIDIPSGWNIEEGDVSGRGLRSSLLVSLTCPKKNAEFFEKDIDDKSKPAAQHWLGGRFLPPKLAEEYGINWLPPYPETEQVVRLK
eukprot:gb/GECG01010045.1/.p1 GENE.gb/GECG01010045.1/~~gb/GECG01010045.1/.p1  ORF type:complete len:309 (+),score=33.48 gb/GECG01010045.1/:1-927(+)